MGRNGGQSRSEERGSEGGRSIHEIKGGGGKGGVEGWRGGSEGGRQADSWERVIVPSSCCHYTPLLDCHTFVLTHALL